jgi:simple sugar transport system ATP-binding protein
MTKGLTTKELARMLVGRDIRVLENRIPRKSQAIHEPILKVDHLSQSKLKNFSFELRPGEILGVAGIEGNGQRELAETLWGVRANSEGSIHLSGVDIHPLDVDERKRAGLSFIPEDRQSQGLILDFDLIENFYLGSRVHFGSHFQVPHQKVKAEVERSISEFEIRTSSAKAKARSLSGGNQQKIVVARELFSNPKVLIAAQPTRGVDIGAIELIHNELIKRRDAGLAILLISCELDELLALSDRIIVMREGVKSAEINDLSGDWTELRYKMGEAMVCQA